MVQEQVQLSQLSVEERAKLDGADLDVEYVYHEDIAEYHVTRAVALENAEPAESDDE